MRSIACSGAIAVWVAITAGLAFTNQSFAQAPINSNVALQPRKGGWIVRQQFRFSKADFAAPGANLDVNLLTSATTVVFGATDSLTFLLTTPAALSKRITNNLTGSRSTTSGLADMTALSKIRLYRNDSSPTDTARFNALAGLELPTGTNGFSSDSVDPIVGGVFTIARGRAFFDADFLWKFNTAQGASPDLLRYDVAFIYRAWPAEYTSPNPTAWNVLLEFNGLYETNGDNELFVAPGVQYITTRWIAEATIQLPIWQEVDNRPESNFILGLSLRFVF